MVQPTPEVLQSHGLKKPDEYFREDFGKSKPDNTHTCMYINIYGLCGDIHMRVVWSCFSRNHKYPKHTLKVLLFTTIHGAGTCASTRQVPARNAQGVVFTNNYWPGYLLQSKSLKEFNI